MKFTSINGFDLLAPIYDPLARLVFGKSILDAQLCFLNQIPSGAKVLILGGGTGWVLAELIKINPQCEVWYIDSSEKMIAKARLIPDDHQNIHFIKGTTNDMPKAGFDVVITHFFLDLFQGPTLQNNISMICSASGPSVLWLVADFVNRGKWWQLILLKIMYGFFRVACRIEAEELPNWGESMRRGGMKKSLSANFCGAFIESSVWVVG